MVGQPKLDISDNHSFLCEKMQNAADAEGIHTTCNFDKTQNLSFRRVVFKKKELKEKKTSTLIRAITFGVRKFWAWPLMQGNFQTSYYWNQKRKKNQNCGSNIPP